MQAPISELHKNSARQWHNTGMDFRAKTAKLAASTLRLAAENEVGNNIPVTKKLKPGARGTQRWLERFGANLVCVRYRHDPRSGRKITTVELIVEDRTVTPARQWVKVDYRESGLRQRIKEMGGQWDAEHRLWDVPTPAIHFLGLEDRVVKKLPHVETKG